MEFTDQKVAPRPQKRPNLAKKRQNSSHFSLSALMGDRTAIHAMAARTIKTLGVCLLNKYVYNLELKSTIGAITDSTEEKENNHAYMRTLL